MVTCHTQHILYIKCTYAEIAVRRIKNIQCALCTSVQTEQIAYRCKIKCTESLQRGEYQDGVHCGHEQLDDLCLRPQANLRVVQCLPQHIAKRNEQHRNRRCLGYERQYEAVNHTSF